MEYVFGWASELPWVKLHLKTRYLQKGGLKNWIFGMMAAGSSWQIIKFFTPESSLKRDLC
jgi:hypothetical protein